MQSFRVVLSVRVESGLDDVGQEQRLTEQIVKKRLQEFFNEEMGSDTSITVCDVEEYPPD